MTRYRWHHKLTGLMIAISCFVMGVFLVCIPWTDAWASNYFAFIQPSSYREASWAEWWRHLWTSPYFRGAVSGLGLVNILVSFVEVLRLRRFSPHPDPLE